MYEVDGRDQVVPVPRAPQSSIGAPCPIVLADEDSVFLVYYIENRDPNWDGESVRVVDLDSSNEYIAIIQFKGCYAHMFGPPNDEAFSGHPLSGRGLAPYGAFEVAESSWLRQLERMNSVHAYHDPQRFLQRRHYVFAFHDSTFECIADGLVMTQQKGSVRSALGAIGARLQ